MLLLLELISLVYLMSSKFHRKNKQFWNLSNDTCLQTLSVVLILIRINYLIQQLHSHRIQQFNL